MPDFCKKTTDGSNITIAERKGGREGQQDVAFVAYPQNVLAIENPSEFFKKEVPLIVQAQKDQENRTTLCSEIAKKIGSDIQITTANLGDSRAVLVVSSKKMARNVAICLTEDHKPDLLRVRTYVESKGGRVLLGRVNGGLAVGAAIGDRLVVGEEQEDCLLRIPDIWQYNLSQYLKDLGFESCDDVTVDLITSCDGLFEEGITVDYERFLDKDNTIH